VENLHMFSIGLILFSIPFTIISHLILLNTPLTALGIGMLILGVSILLTPINPIPSSTVRSLLEGSVLSLEAILEGFNTSSKGYYILHDDGRVYVYIPLTGQFKPPTSKTPPKSIFVEDGEAVYLVLPPPASELARFEGISDMNVEDAISHILVDVAELTSSVNIATSEGIVLELKGLRSHVAAGRFRRVFGSLEASIAACIAASILKRPIYVESEFEEEDLKRITIKPYG